MSRTMNTMLLAAVAAVGLFAAPACAGEDAKAVAAKEQSLIAVLASDAPGGDKAIACKELAIYGSAKAVPQLAPLLADPQLSSWSRTALEVIPGAEADAALRDAAGKLEGRVLIGVLNSIAFRRDAKAVDVLTERLSDKDTAVASAAAVALGRIGNAAATKTLRAALSKAPAGVRSAVAEGCILCAERLMSGDSSDEAGKIYDEVRTADVPKPRILEATRGAILARKSGGVELLIEQIRSPDKAFYYIGLSTARELPGREATEAIAAELAEVGPDHAAALLAVLGDRNDPAAAPAVLKAVKSSPKPVRIAAIGVLGRFADASTAPALLDIAGEDDAELSAAAKQTLTGLKGEKIDSEIARRLGKADGQMLITLIELVGARRIEATTDLIAALKHDDAETRSAALAALGETVAAKDLGVLISQATSPTHLEDAPAAQRALRAAAVRMPDREKCSSELAAAMVGASAQTKDTLLEILGAVGGSKALATLATAANGADPQLQDTSTRLLGAWMSVDAGPVLLDIAKTAKEEKYQIRAMRGYIRLARQFAKSPAQRAEMCDKALEAAGRVDERKLVLQVLELYPSVDALKVAVKASETKELKDDATRVSLAIVQKIGGKDASAKELLAKIGLAPVKLEIVKGEYGAGEAKRDVTDILRKQARDLPLVGLPSESYNAAFGGDPAPGVVKQLRINYRMNGKEGEATFAENATILLPMP
ncbi:MAG: HEAT repeat domain-containing protein [Pirellulales bacterium]